MKRLMLTTALILYMIAGNSVSLAQSGQHKRDPFAPLDKSMAPQSAKIIKKVKKPSTPDGNNLLLNGIIWNKDNPLAIIDDTVVKIGSVIAGRKVIAISVYHVEVEYRGKEETLNIVPKILFSITSEKVENKSGVQTGSNK